MKTKIILLAITFAVARFAARTSHAKPDGAVASPPDYQIGGPLEGVKLPLYPTQHGEKPGHPGSIPELKTTDERGRVLFTPEGLAPERQLFDGSVEHFRAYYFKYLPVKSFFDRQSLLKNWKASEVFAGRAQDYAEPVYWVPRHLPPRPTGKFNQPVRVVRCGINDPVFALDAGTLRPGMYCVRVVGAVETKDLVRHRKPLLFRLTVNDGPKGEETTYRIRGKYVDEFYALTEIYFHAPAERAYRLTVAVDEGSLVSPLIYNIELHDALAGVTDRAIKTKSTLNPPLAAVPKPPPDDAARLQKDTDLWRSWPPLNAQPSRTHGGGKDDAPENQPNWGAGGMSPEQIVAQYGKWQTAALGSVLLKNDKLHLQYSVADLENGKPLPDPYPFKDRGTGVYTPSARDGEPPQNWCPISLGVRDRARGYMTELTNRVRLFREKGDVKAGRDAAVMLCRVAWDFPGYDSSNHLTFNLMQPGSMGQDWGCRRREPDVPLRGTWALLDDYDKLFDLIRADPGLAASVGRFVPGIKTPQDVVRFLDGYLVQTMAKRVLRYLYFSDNEPTLILKPVLVLGDPQFTHPWMDWLFSGAFVYPQSPSGLQDLLVTGSDRDGVGYIASFFYCQGEQSAPKAAELETYVESGGDPKFDLRDPKRYPKPIAACNWFINTRMAGLYFPRIGDVDGPDKHYGEWFVANFQRMMPLGWKWTRDPRFAYVLKNYLTREGWTDPQWNEIEKAAATVHRAPWLDGRSRVVANWFGLLETGVEHDDPRFRRDVYLRVGQGYGHQHEDSLDLQGNAHGYPFTIDGGQRKGYSEPSDPTTRVHNLVEIDGLNWRSHSWVTALSDGEGARYLAAETVPSAKHENVRLYRRQVTLIDVDDPVAPQKLSVAQTGPAPKGLPVVGATPDSYIFDVVRVAGGTNHTYCFHGPLEDDLQTNARDVTKGWDQLKDPADQGYLRKFPEKDRVTAGTAPAVLEATWRMTRDPNVEGGTGYGTEKGINPAIWDESSPRKYTRLHLLGEEGARVLTGRLVCNALKYGFTNLYLQKRGTNDSESAFAALIEPYVGTPFIRECALVTIPGNETDARRAVAVAVKTTNGHTDLCFADGRPDRLRTFEISNFKSQVSGEFAYYSTDAHGLRAAALTGGTLLETPEVTLRPANREHSGIIRTCNYLEKTFTVDQPWAEAAILGGSVLELSNGHRPTAYTVRSASTENGSTRVTVTGGADYYLSRVRSVDAANNQVHCVLAPPNVTKEDANPCPRINPHWAASTEDGRKSWRADYVGLDADDGDYIFQLDGPVQESDFGESGGFRLWEYGAGDRVRQDTAVHLRRVEPRMYELQANIETTVGLKVRGTEISADRKSWKPLNGQTIDGKMEAVVRSADLLGGQGRVYLRVKE